MGTILSIIEKDERRNLSANEICMEYRLEKVGCWNAAAICTQCKSEDRFESANKHIEEDQGKVLPQEKNDKQGGSLLAFHICHPCIPQPALGACHMAMRLEYATNMLAVTELDPMNTMFVDEKMFVLRPDTGWA